MSDPLLDVRELCVALHGPSGTPIVQDLSFQIRRGEKLAIVGESGCGKSVTSLAIMGLLPPALRQSGGSIRFDGQDLAQLPPRLMRALRGARIAMIFQEPMSSLNPSLTVGVQITEMLHAHGAISRAAARRRAVELLDQVRIPEPARVAGDYPHRLSGGQRQRVVIAIAIALGPDLIIADEPTTALDVTTQAQIMDLLGSLQRGLGSAVLLITHNLGLVAQVADRMMVMYAGRKVEEATTHSVFATQYHPYTRGLLAATPDPRREAAPGPVLHEIPGLVPSIHDRQPGCAFAPRCDRARDVCRISRPALSPTPSGLAACFVDAESPAA